MPPKATSGGLGLDKGARKRPNGFTLIELAIVLVIIGLLVGGVLAGQELISKAAVRAQITQVEKFNAAANTFFVKYGYLPGDIPAGPAALFGFAARGANPGEGDGNGLLQDNFGGNASGYSGPAGETALFWEDLSAAHLIEGTFVTATATGNESSNIDVGYPGINNYLPASKIGAQSSIYVWNGGISSDLKNYFTISQVVDYGYGVRSAVSLTVAQSYAIDKKIDDGFPQSGNIQAFYLNWGAAGNGFGDAQWASGGPIVGGESTVAGASSATGGATTNATPASPTTCYDNGNVGGAAQQYSLTQNNGNGVNCALSFRMQAGD